MKSSKTSPKIQNKNVKKRTPSLGDLLKKLYTPQQIISSFYISGVGGFGGAAAGGSPFSFNPGYTFSYTFSAPTPPLKITTRMEGPNGRYWTEAVLSDDPKAFEIIHCSEYLVDVVGSTSCPGCSWASGEAIKYVYGCTYPFGVTAKETIKGKEYLYIKRENFNILGHFCESTNDIDLIIGEDEKPLFKVDRKSCLLCGAAIKGEEMLNYLRLKKGTE